MNLAELELLVNNQDYHNFIDKNINADTNALRLKKFPLSSFDSKFAILQIDCKNRIKKKLPELYGTTTFIFPNILSTEQCTAQKIAEFHATLLQETDNVLDMTAGLCVDSYYISKHVKHVTSLEINEETATAATFNMSRLAKNITVINTDCIKYINNCTTKYDVIFIDPARRGDNNKRLFGLADCVPNVLELLPRMQETANTLYIKASPMIDITQSIKELNHCVSDVWAIGLNNECKELLFKVDLKSTTQLKANIHTLNFENSEIQELSESTELSVKVPQIPQKDNFMYEPNRCIMKAQIFDTVESVYKVSRLQQNSHLFTGSHYIENFPGRKFQIDEIIPFKSKEIKTLKNKHPQMNVSVRNFKLSADELKKKLKINDGGDKYLFGTTDLDGNAILIICHKA